MPFSISWVFVVLGLILIVVGMVFAVRVRRDAATPSGSKAVPVALVVGLGAGLLVPSALTLAGAA